MDLTQIDPPGSTIDRDEPRLEEEVQIDGVDSVIAVHNLLASSSSSTSTPAIKSRKIKTSPTAAAVDVEEKAVREPVLKKGKK